MRKPRRSARSFITQSKHSETVIGSITHHYRLQKLLNLKLILFIFATILAPLILGGIWYITSSDELGSFVGKGYIPDLLWAFSLTSTLLIIWDGRINAMWLTVLMLLFPLFEFLQTQHIIAGTGDVLDVVCYYLSALVSFYLYKTCFKTAYYEH